jgi:hypothetical protein
LAKNKYDLVYINLWRDKHTIVTPQGAVFPNCEHNLRDETGLHCLSCKAYLGSIGEEFYDVTYYEHIYQLQNRLNYEELVIKTDRYYPSQYSPLPERVFQKLSKSTKLLKYNKTYIYKKDGKKVTDIDTFIIHFSKLKRNIKKFDLYTGVPTLKTFYKKDFKKVLVINPDYSDLSYSKFAINVISNERLYKKLEKVR